MDKKLTIKSIEDEYPDLFKNCYDFSIGDGWLPLIDRICFMVTNHKNSIETRLEWAIKNKDKFSFYKEEIPELKKELKTINKSPFEWHQIKEKFGTGRFYISGGSPQIQNWIEFAEAMTEVLCEIHGNLIVGQIKKPWVKRVCENCIVESSLSDEEVFYN